MVAKKVPKFSKREQEMMDIVYRLRHATAAGVLAEMASPPSYSSVRSTLSGLEKKGHLTHEFDGNRYIYRPTVKLEAARSNALTHLRETFFEGSTTAVVATLLEERGSKLTADELKQISKLISKSREEGR